MMLPRSKTLANYRLELGNIISRGHITCPARGEDLLTCQLLPVRVHGEQDGGPRQQGRGRVFPGEEHGLAFFHDIVHRDRRRRGFQRTFCTIQTPSIRFFSHARFDHRFQQIFWTFIGRRIVVVSFVYPHGDELLQGFLDFFIQSPRNSILSRGEEPNNKKFGINKG